MSKMLSSGSREEQLDRLSCRSFHLFFILFNFFLLIKKHAAADGGWWYIINQPARYLRVCVSYWFRGNTDRDARVRDGRTRVCRSTRVIVYRKDYVIKKLGVCWMYRRWFQRSVTSPRRRGPTVCWRNTSVSGVPRTDLRTGSCNHPRSSSPPSQFTLKRNPG